MHASEVGAVIEGASAAGILLARERGNWEIEWEVRKFLGDWSAEQIDRGEADRAEFERRTIYGNGLLNAGIGLLEDLLIGAGGTVYNNANSRLYVGNGNAAFNATHTDLQGASKTAKVMDATYPSRSGQTLTWRSTFATGDANYAWEEWGILNGAPPVSASVILLNRKVESLGTKTSAHTWQFTGTVVIS